MQARMDAAAQVDATNAANKAKDNLQATEDITESQFSNAQQQTILAGAESIRKANDQLQNMKQAIAYI